MPDLVIASAIDTLLQATTKAAARAALSINRGRVVTPEEFSAVGDGIADDYTPLTNMLAALSPGDSVLLSGTYAHSGVIYFTTAYVTVFGGGTLKATVENTSAVKVTANNVTMDCITFSMDARVGRGTTGDHWKLMIDQCSGFVGRNLRVNDSYGLGIGFYGATDFWLDQPYINVCAADGIHFTYGAKRWRVTSPTVIAPEDDYVSTVSYGSDPSACEDIVVTNIKARGQTVTGRGITIVGGTRIRYIGFEVEDTIHGGIYVAAEATDSSKDITDCLIERGTVKNANTGFAVVDHAAIWVSTGLSSQTLSGVTIRDVTVTDTLATRVIGIVKTASSTLDDVIIEDIRMEGTNPSTLATSGSPTYRMNRIYRDGVLEP